MRDFQKWFSTISMRLICVAISKRTKSKWKRKCLIFSHISSNLWNKIDIHLNLDGPPCKTFLISLMHIYSITHLKIFTTKFIHPFAFESRFSHSHSLAIYLLSLEIGFAWIYREAVECVCVLIWDHSTSCTFCLISISISIKLNWIKLLSKLI